MPSDCKRFYNSRRFDQSTSSACCARWVLNEICKTINHQILQIFHFIKLYAKQNIRLNNYTINWKCLPWKWISSKTFSIFVRDKLHVFQQNQLCCLYDWRNLWQKILYLLWEYISNIHSKSLSPTKVGQYWRVKIAMVKWKILRVRMKVNWRTATITENNEEMPKFKELNQLEN